MGNLSFITILFIAFNSFIISVTTEKAFSKSSRRTSIINLNNQRSTTSSSKTGTVKNRNVNRNINNRNVRRKKIINNKNNTFRKSTTRKRNFKVIDKSELKIFEKDTANEELTDWQLRELRRYYKCYGIISRMRPDEDDPYIQKIKTENNFIEAKEHAVDGCMELLSRADLTGSNIFSSDLSKIGESAWVIDSRKG